LKTFLIAWKKAVPLQPWSGPEGSRKVKFPDFMKTAQDGGKVVSLMHWPPLPPGNAPGTNFCWRISRPQGHSAMWWWWCFCISAWRWLYIAETCSWLLVKDKDMFELRVCILLQWHVYLNTTEMPSLKIMNCGVLSPGQIKQTNRITVLTEKLPHENGDVPECAILQLRARNPQPPDVPRLYTIMFHHVI